MADNDERSCASAAALAGLAGEVEGLRRRVEAVADLPGQVAALSSSVNAVADQVAQRAARSGSGGLEPWLTLPGDREALREELADLASWMQDVFLRYDGAAEALPECWLWHPGVIEELLWLREAWRNAYHSASASAALVGDWHDRYRPGVVRRLRNDVGNCSLESHQPAREAPRVPLVDALEPLADWWADERDRPAPEPTKAHRDSPSRRRAGGGRR